MVREGRACLRFGSRAAGLGCTAVAAAAWQPAGRPEGCLPTAPQGAAAEEMQPLLPAAAAGEQLRSDPVLQAGWLILSKAALRNSAPPQQLWSDSLAKVLQ